MGLLVLPGRIIGPMRRPSTPPSSHASMLVADASPSLPLQFLVLSAMRSLGHHNSLSKRIFRLWSDSECFNVYLCDQVKVVIRLAKLGASNPTFICHIRTIATDGLRRWSASAWACLRCMHARYKSNLKPVSQLAVGPLKSHVVDIHTKQQGERPLDSLTSQTVPCLRHKFWSSSIRWRTLTLDVGTCMHGHNILALYFAGRMWTSS